MQAEGTQCLHHIIICMNTQGISVFFWLIILTPVSLYLTCRLNMRQFLVRVA